MKVKTLNDIYDRKNNSFDDMRFVLASLVLFVHSYALLYGESGAKDFFVKMTNYQLGLSTIAVYGFFILSGFFMIQSLESNSSFLKYTKNRVLRIIPAFWMSLGLFSFLIIPMISHQIDIFSFNKGSSLEFFIKAGTFHIFGYAWNITGAFPNNPMMDAINGSMWTLKHEIALYFILPLIVWLTYAKRNLLLIVFSVFFLLALLNITTGFNLFTIPCCRAWVFASNEYPFFIVFASYFFAGVIFYKFKDYILISKRFFLLFVFLFILSMFLGNMKIITLISLPYIILYFGSVYRKKIFSIKGDYSYGMYIYAFPIQQILVHFYKNDINAIQLFMMSFIITLFVSILSWHFFEKKILKMKNFVIKKNSISKERKYEHI